MPAPDAQRDRPLAVANSARRSVDAADSGTVESSAVPAYTYLESAACAQSRDAALRPRETPSRARVAADFERPPGRGEEVGRRARRYLRARKKSVEVRDVSVVHLGRFHVPVFEPLLQLPCLARLHQGHAWEQRRELRREVSINAENTRGLDAVVEEIADDLRVHRRACADGDAAGMNVLRRERGARH